MVVDALNNEENGPREVVVDVVTAVLELKSADNGVKIDDDDVGAVTVTTGLSKS